MRKTEENKIDSTKFKNKKIKKKGKDKKKSKD